MFRSTVQSVQYSQYSTGCNRQASASHLSDERKGWERTSRAVTVNYSSISMGSSASKQPPVWRETCPRTGEKCSRRTRAPMSSVFEFKKGCLCFGLRTLPSDPSDIVTVLVTGQKCHGFTGQSLPHRKLIKAVRVHDYVGPTGSHTTSTCRDGYSDND
eukprot:g2694.t1